MELSSDAWLDADLVCQRRRQLDRTAGQLAVVWPVGRIAASALRPVAGARSQAGAGAGLCLSARIAAVAHDACGAGRLCGPMARDAVWSGRAGMAALAGTGGSQPVGTRADLCRVVAAAQA